MECEKKLLDRSIPYLRYTKASLNAWREAWAEHVNAALERAGIAARVDHRSLKAQRIDRGPVPHIGRAAWEMERRGVETRRGGRWREVRERNALREPEG
jgi:hypothetical protein